MVCLAVVEVAVGVGVDVEAEGLAGGSVVARTTEVAMTNEARSIDQSIDQCRFDFEDWD